MRVFIAADVSAKVGIIKLQQEIMSNTWSSSEASPVERNNFHFVLMFLGEQDEGMVGRIKAKLLELKFEPIWLTYTGITGHPEPDSASTIGLGVDEQSGWQLTDLAAKVASKMKEVGLEPDKPFVPRITIFHAKDRPLEVGRAFAKYRGKTFGSDLVDKIHVRKTNSSPPGRFYSDVFTVNAVKKQP